MTLKSPAHADATATAPAALHRDGGVPPDRAERDSQKPHGWRVGSTPSQTCLDPDGWDESDARPGRPARL